MRKCLNKRYIFYTFQLLSITWTSHPGSSRRNYSYTGESQHVWPL